MESVQLKIVKLGDEKGKHMHLLADPKYVTNIHGDV